jgi:hypothetical protein
MCSTRNTVQISAALVQREYRVTIILPFIYIYNILYWGGGVVVTVLLTN